jgi:hypothetical protein
MYQLRQSRTSHGQLASRRVYFLLGIITRLPTHATLNTVYSPPFRTGVSSLNVFFLITSSITCLGVINIINPWLVPDHSPSTITRTDRSSWSPLTTHIKANLLVGMCPHRCSKNNFYLAHTCRILVKADTSTVHTSIVKKYFNFLFFFSFF